MNYIMEINRFYDWLETNSISKSSIALWHALMHIDNKTNWKSEFTVAMSVLELKTGFKNSELYKARNELQEKGRLIWNSRSGNQSATYKIIPFCLHSMETNGKTNRETNDRQTETINKLDEIKLNSYLEEEKFEGFEIIIPDDNIPRNIEGLIRFLIDEIYVTNAEANKIICQSNYGQKYTPLWKAIKKIRENKGIKSKEINNPVNYIFKYLEDSKYSASIKDL